MATVIGALNINVRANTGSFTKKMKGARRTVGNFGTSITAIGKKLITITAIAAAAGTAIATAMIKSQLTAVDAIAKTSDKLGIQTEKLIALQHAGELSGVGVNTMNMALQRMTRRLAEAGQGTGESLGAIKELGLDAAKLARQSPDQAFRAIAEAMKGVSNQSDRVRLAFKFFDSEGVALVNTLKGGAAALDAAAKKTAMLGTAISRIDAAQIEAANNAMHDVGQAVVGAARQFAVKLAPFIELAANKIIAFVDEIGGVGTIVDTVVNFAVKGFGIFIDAVDAIGLAFTGMQAIALKGFAAIISGGAKVIEGFEKIMELAGFDVDPSSNFLSEFADSLNDQADQAGSDWWDRFLAPPPSAKLENWISGISDKARTAAELAVAPAFDALDQLDAKQNKIRGSVTAGALSRGSVEAFRAINSGRQGDDMKTLADNSDKQLAVEREQLAVGRKTLMAMRNPNIQLALVQL